MSDEEILTKLFKGQLDLPDVASDWLLDIYEVFQTFDDYADGDTVSRDRLDILIYRTLVVLPTNHFFLQYVHLLSPVLSLAIMKWKASDTMEKSGQANENSFSWRASYYDLVLAVVSITHGPNIAMKTAHTVLSMYGEKYSDYAKEFKCQPL